jgi:hypothetical protein
MDIKKSSVMNTKLEKAVVHFEIKDFCIVVAKEQVT